MWDYLRRTLKVLKSDAVSTAADTVVTPIEKMNQVLSRACHIAVRASWRGVIQCGFYGYRIIGLTQC
jgi:hypothetical protein